MHTHDYPLNGSIAAACDLPHSPGQTMHRMVGLPMYHAVQDAADTPEKPSMIQRDRVWLMRFPGSDETWILDIPDE